MKEYNIKRHYCTKHAAKFDGIGGQLQFDEIEQFKKSLSIQEVFHAAFIKCFLQAFLSTKSKVQFSEASSRFACLQIKKETEVKPYSAFFSSGQNIC